MKFFSVILALGAAEFACGPVLGAGESGPDSGYRLTVHTDRAQAEYRRGETVTFLFELSRQGLPVEHAEVDSLISQDGVAPESARRLRIEQGRAIVTATSSVPGFLQCRATLRPAGSAPLVALAGAAIEPQQIEPAAPPPRDFAAFWAEEKRQLAMIPPNPRLTPVHSPNSTSGIECFDLRADAIGAPVSGYLARPSGARPGTLPAILLLHGAGVSSSRLGEVVRWAGEGLLALDLNAHGLPNGLPGEVYAALGRGALKDYWYRGRESRESYYYLGVFLRLVRAIDVLTLQPEWDGRVIIAHGYSQGGAQALVAAGLDERVTFFAAGIPAMCDHAGLLAGRVSGWPKLIPRDASGRPDPRVAATAGYYDAVNFGRLTKAPGIVSAGFVDTACPPTSVYAAFNALTVPKQMLNYPPLGHVHPPEMENAMRAAILEHVAANRPHPSLPDKAP